MKNIFVAFLYLFFHTFAMGGIINFQTSLLREENGIKNAIISETRKITSQIKEYSEEVELEKKIQGKTLKVLLSVTKQTEVSLQYKKKILHKLQNIRKKIKTKEGEKI